MNYILLFLPIILGYLTNFFCNYSMLEYKNQNKIIPKWIFFIIWPVLYLLIGYLWSKNSNIEFWLILILNILLCCWLIFNNCIKNSIISLIILILTILLVLIIFLLFKSNIDKLLILPLLVWLIIVIIIQNIK